MNPYEETANEMKRQSEGPKRFAKKAIGVGAALGASSFAPMLARAAPLLSQYIPENIAIKGLSKISPKFGKFVKESMDNGFDFKKVKDFIGQQVNESQENAKDQRNIIQQYSPELHQFLSNEISGGRPAIEAGALAQSKPEFQRIIKKLSDDHKTPFSSILESIYGGGQYGDSQAAMREDAMNPPGSQPTRPPSAEQMVFSGQGKQQNPQSNQVDEALIAALDKILKM